MAVHKFTLGGSVVKGFRVNDNGAVLDWEGTLRNTYRSLSRASIAARRKYGDQSITVTECETSKRSYEVDLDELMKIAKQVD